MHPCIEHDHCSVELQGVGAKCGEGLHRRVRHTVKRGWVDA
jgi:hypothetical protein